MKSALLIISFIFVFGHFVNAQCIGYIPPGSVVVSDVQVIDGGFDPIWVCPGGTLHTDGGFHNIFLEPGATMTTEGGIDTIYVKDGAAFYMEGGIHVIFYVTASNLHISGGIATENLCSSLLFDYSNAPPNGCALAPVAAFQSSDSAFCSATCINFFDLSSNATSWQWFFPGATPSSSTDQNPTNICYDSSASFDVTLVATNDISSDTLTISDFITVYEPPSLSPISQSGDTLFSIPGYTSYQWYLDSTLIIGATDYFYVASQGGDYTVVVTDNNGCSSSQLLKDVTTGISSGSLSGNNQVIAFPNPASDLIFILDERSELLLFNDIFGRELLRVQTTSFQTTEVDVSEFPSVFIIHPLNGNPIKVLRH